MSGTGQRASTTSILALAFALVLTALLPNVVVGDPAPAVTPTPDFTASEFVDTTAADFAAGTPDSGIYIAETADGEVMLQPAFGTEFSGSGLPAGMSIFIMGDGGSVVVADGHLVVDGARVGTDAVFGPGRNLEFVEIESGGSFEMGGFGQTFAVGEQFAAFRTGLIAFKLQASTDAGAQMETTPIGPYQGSSHVLRVDWRADSVHYFVDGSEDAIHDFSPSSDLRPLFSDVPVRGRVLTIDWMRMSPYAESGTFESRIFDAGSNAHWTSLLANWSALHGGSVSLETRTGDTAVPDAGWSPWAPVDAATAIGSPDARYLQYRALLTTADTGFSPALESVRIDYLAPCGTEICDGIDNDCDGLVDEDFPARPTTCGVGACAATGTTSCANGEVHDSCQAGTQLLETDPTCDGVDDDCDGQVDEDFVGFPTLCGTGACASQGTTVCEQGHVRDTCTPGTPAAADANCDGVDDDCDGKPDDDYVGASTTCGVGACAATGSIVCEQGHERDTCVTGTPAEKDATCDGKDDDCDGTADEDFVPAATTCGVGACASSGVTACEQGHERDTCAPGHGAEKDATCDGRDDDCDGTADEDYAPAATTCGVGACASAGTTVCEGGHERDTCAPGQPAAGDASCNGVDDDCDGRTDEDYVPQATRCGIGECAATGTTVCEAGHERDACVPGQPAAERCDGKDNDCDGNTDEDFTLGGACSSGVGACASTGVVACAADGNGTICTAQPGTPSTEICDGIDNDCDGSVDEGALRLEAVCNITPASLNLASQGGPFGFSLTLRNTCGATPQTVAPSAIGTAHISRAGNITFPDPSSVSCPGATETGIFEDPAARSTIFRTVVMKFDRASDGSCATQDGDRQGLLAALADMPNNSTATICIAGTVGDQTWECCDTAKVLSPQVRRR